MTHLIHQGRLASGFNGRGCVMNYPNKREIIQELLEENGPLDWYVAQPDKQNPASGDAKCILLNFVEKKRAELIVPNDWFQDPCRYGGISELIGLAVQNPTRQSSRNIPHIIFFFPKTASKWQPRRVQNLIFSCYFCWSLSSLSPTNFEGIR